MSNQGIEITLKEKKWEQKENDRRARTFICVSFLPGQEDKRKGQEVVKVAKRWSQTKGRNNPNQVSVCTRGSIRSWSFLEAGSAKVNGFPWTFFSHSLRVGGLGTSVVLRAFCYFFLKSSALRTAKAESYCSCSRTSLFSPRSTSSTAEPRTNR